MFIVFYLDCILQQFYKYPYNSSIRLKLLKQLNTLSLYFLSTIVVFSNGSLTYKKLSISGSWFIRLSNPFVCPDPEPPTINILCGWLGISGQFGLCSFMSSSVIYSKLNFFVLFYYIIKVDFFPVTH